MKWLLRIGVVAALGLFAFGLGRLSSVSSSEGPYPTFWKKLPKTGDNNVWYEKNDSETAIIFVHGIFSDSRSCWLHLDSKNLLNSQYWPALIESDSRFEHPAIFLGGYFTGVDSGPYDARQAAGELRDALKSKGVLEKQNLIFIAHSAGGIVTRFLLYHNQELFRGKRIGLVLYASPSVGTPLGNMLAFLSDFYGNKLGKQLQRDSSFLNELDKDFRELLYNRNSDPDNLKIVGAEGVENFFIIHRRILPDKISVVPENSASLYFGAPVYLRKTDHFTTVKPDGEQHPGHQLLISFYAKYKKDFGLTVSSPSPKQLPVFKTVYDEKADQEYTDVQVFEKNSKYTQPLNPAGDNGHELVVDMAVPGKITRVSFQPDGPAAGWTHETTMKIDQNSAHWIGWSNSGDPARLIFTIYYRRGHQVCVANCETKVGGRETTPGTPESKFKPPDQPRVTACQAGQHIGGEETVCGFVESTYYDPSAPDSTEKPTFLNLNDDDVDARVYPNHCFAVVIWGKHRDLFPSPPEQKYLKKKICIRGKITTFTLKETARQVPQIHAEKPNQIWPD